MTQNTDGPGDSLVLELLLPVGRESEHAIRVAIQDINHGLQLTIVDLVAVDPDLEIPLNPGLADFLQKSRDYRHVVVEHDDIWLLTANALHEMLIAESLLWGGLHGRRVNDVNTGGVLAILGGSLRVLLESEMDEIQPGELGELLQNAMGDLGIAGELMSMCTHQHELHLGLCHLYGCVGYALE